MLEQPACRRLLQRLTLASFCQILAARLRAALIQRRRALRGRRGAAAAVGGSGSATDPPRDETGRVDAAPPVRRPTPRRDDAGRVRGRGRSPGTARSEVCLGWGWGLHASSRPRKLPSPSSHDTRTTPLTTVKHTAQAQHSSRTPPSSRSSSRWRSGIPSSCRRTGRRRDFPRRRSSPPRAGPSPRPSSARPRRRRLFSLSAGTS